MKFLTLFWTVLLFWSAINTNYASSLFEDNSIDASKSSRFPINVVYPRTERDFICREYDETFQLIMKTKHELEKSGCIDQSRKLSNGQNNFDKNNLDTIECTKLFDQHLKQYKKLVYLTHIRTNFYGY